MISSYHSELLSSTFSWPHLLRGLRYFARKFDFLEVFAVALAAALAFPKLFSAAEQFGSQIANKKALTIGMLAIAVIVLRLSFLWALPVPVPHVQDEFSYLLAGDTFAHGRLSNPPHPMSVYFDTFHENQRPRYMSIYFPGQGLALAAGEVLGNPWIGVLLSVSAMTGAITWALYGWFSARWALLGGILVLFHFSLTHYWMNSYWGGAVAAIGGALVFGAYPRIIRWSKRQWGNTNLDRGRAQRCSSALLGLGCSILVLSRPFEGFIFSLPVLIALSVWILRGQNLQAGEKLRRVLAPFALVMLGCAAFVGYYNWRGTGDPVLFPYVLNVRTHMSIPQLAWEKPTGPFHFQNPQFEAYYNRWWPQSSWAEGRPNGIGNIFRELKTDLGMVLSYLLWPEVLFVIAALLWMARDRKMRLPFIQLICSCAGFVLVGFFRPHYAAPLTVVLFALVVQALRHIRQFRWEGEEFGRHVMRAGVVLAMVLPFFRVRHNPNYSRVEYREAVIQRVDATPGEHLVIVEYAPTHDPNDEWVYNAAKIDAAKIVWAREIPGVSLEPLLEYYSGRKVWVVQPDAKPPKIEAVSNAGDLRPAQE